MGYNTEYRRKGIMVDIIIKDENFAQLDKFKCNVNTFPQVAKILSDKYGLRLNPEIEHKDSVNKDKDIDWLKKADW